MKIVSYFKSRDIRLRALGVIKIKDLAFIDNVCVLWSQFISTLKYLFTYIYLILAISSTCIFLPISQSVYWTSWNYLTRI